ncbi:hypothetical protein, partial [Pyrinomonas sp.]|uniref:hypothetical protein n=1 Tax=Pyrinomonas sp. TaxID=2080306 RepID=UPI00332B9DC3
LLRKAKNVVAGSGEPCQCFEQNRGLFGINLEFAFDGFNGFHGCITLHIRKGDKRLSSPD